MPFNVSVATLSVVCAASFVADFVARAASLEVVSVANPFAANPSVKIKTSALSFIPHFFLQISVAIDVPQCVS
jgi:hypothetical protein